MLTRQGVIGLGAGIVALVVGRVFGVVELFVIGAGFLAAVGIGLLAARLGAPRLAASRTVRPTMLVARDLGRVDIRLRHLGGLTSAFELVEQVRQPNASTSVARLRVASLRRRTATTAGYRLPTNRRGIVTVGPLVVHSSDPLGVAQVRRVIADVETITVAPRAYLVAMPQLGQGVLGRQLLAQARRLGPGEFHSLREYSPGDEPRSIHWRASARSDDLLVKQHTLEGLRRCTVVLDATVSSYLDLDGFERAVTVAASIVHSSHHVALATRFVTAGGIDLRGPDVAFTARRVLAEIQAGPAPLGDLERDPSDGLGVLIVITGGRASHGWRSAAALIDPTTALVRVHTDEPGRDAATIGARSDEEFLASWRVLTGRTGSNTSTGDPTASAPSAASTRAEPR